ncbi:hypothetical protein [Acidilobus sp.]|uniref:hypothetical protein n=1 Tax=Acidilobus sp. TaxID=1872109 RepID=UPI003D040662
MRAMPSALPDEAVSASIELARQAIREANLAYREGLRDVAEALKSLGESAREIAMYLAKGDVEKAYEMVESSSVESLVVYASPNTKDAYEHLRYLLVTTRYSRVRAARH